MPEPKVYSLVSQVIRNSCKSRCLILTHKVPFTDVFYLPCADTFILEIPAENILLQNTIPRAALKYAITPTKIL